MNLVLPYKGRAIILKDYVITKSEIDMFNNTIPVNGSFGVGSTRTSTGRTITAQITVVAGDIVTPNKNEEDFEVAQIREKTVRECSLGELILAIAGKS